MVLLSLDMLELTFHSPTSENCRKGDLQRHEPFCKAVKKIKWVPDEGFFGPPLETPKRKASQIPSYVIVAVLVLSWCSSFGFGNEVRSSSSCNLTWHNNYRRHVNILLRWVMYDT